jgi:phage/plasmid-like protein (TIGR03299 family)
MPANVETMAYSQERGLPWHGEGNAVSGLQTAEEMIEASGLAWEVELQPVALANDPSIISPDKFATVRSTDKAWLGTVGRQYQVVQNREAFQFADDLVDDGQAKYDTAGALRGGRVVFLSMELGHLEVNIDLKGKYDEHLRTYLLLSNAHDGSRALEADITKTRVVCENTLNVGVKGASRRFKIRHSGSIEGKLAAAREALGITFKYDEAFNAAAKQLIQKELVKDQILSILRTAVWPIDDETASESRLENHPSTLAMENLLTSATIPDALRLTGWGVFNAVTEFIDHQQEYRGRYDSIADVRANSILWGTGQAKKQAAFDALVKVASRR